MGDLTKGAVIKVPVDKLYNYTSNPHNAPGYISSIHRVISGPEGTPSVGQTWQVEANFLGKPAVLTLRLVELVSSKRVRFQLQGQPEALLTLDLTPSGTEATQVLLTLDVPSVPAMFLQGFMGGLLGADMERLKAIMET